MIRPAPLWDRLKGKVQELAGGANSFLEYDRRGELKSVPADSERTVGGNQAGPAGLLVRNVQARGTLPATWNVYVNGNLVKSDNTNLARPIGLVDYQQKLPPFATLEVKVTHTATGEFGDFEVTAHYQDPTYIPG